MARARSPTQYTQYSKRLCGAITAFWCAVRLLGLVIVLFRPELGTSLAGILQGADDVMICNVAMYCGNSVAEKGIVHYFDAKKQPTEAENAAENGTETPFENG